MPDGDSDAAVIANSLEQPIAFAAIFDRHYDAVHGYLSRRAGTEVADELSAQTFEEAFRARRRYDPSRVSARGWLLGIATNLLRHHFRAETRRLAAYGRVPREAPELGDAANAANARLDAQALMPALARALAELPAPDRDVLLLFAWAELSYDEIAAALGIPTGTVRSRLHRSRERLRELLAASGQYHRDELPLSEARRPHG